MKAVCYLNSFEEDFRGGIFHFQDGEPANFVPMSGVSESLLHFWAYIDHYQLILTSVSNV